MREIAGQRRRSPESFEIAYLSLALDMVIKCILNAGGTVSLQDLLHSSKSMSSYFCRTSWSTEVIMSLPHVVIDGKERRRNEGGCIWGPCRMPSLAG